MLRGPFPEVGRTRMESEATQSPQSIRASKLIRLRRFPVIHPSSLKNTVTRTSGSAADTISPASHPTPGGVGATSPAPGCSRSRRRRPGRAAGRRRDAGRGPRANRPRAPRRRGEALSESRSEVRLRLGNDEVTQGGQRGCPKDGRGADNSMEEALCHEHVRSGRRESAVRRRGGSKSGVPDRVAEHDHGGVNVGPDLDAGAPAPLGQESCRHLGERARRQRGRRVAPAIVMVAAGPGGSSPPRPAVPAAAARSPPALSTQTAAPGWEP
jgi:hypothetical protein